MGMNKAIMSTHSTQHVEPQKVVHNGYILDEQGKEVKITSDMVHSICHQLLQQCRMIKN